MTKRQKQAVLRLYGLEKLEDATRKIWPWWRDDSPFVLYSSAPRMPDFPNDHAAAVELAARMEACVMFEQGCGWTFMVMDEGRYTFFEDAIVKSTLGAALLAALVYYDN